MEQTESALVKSEIIEAKKKAVVRFARYRDVKELMGEIVVTKRAIELKEHTRFMAEDTEDEYDKENEESEHSELCTLREELSTCEKQLIEAKKGYKKFCKLY